MLTSLQSKSEIKKYLDKVHNLLDLKGTFCFLVTFNKRGKSSYVENLSDGRSRMFFALEDFSKEPFSGLFKVKSKKIITYPAKSPSNPYSKITGNKKEISLIQVVMSKKI